MGNGDKKMKHLLHVSKRTSCANFSGRWKLPDWFWDRPLVMQWDAMLIASIVLVAGVCAQSQQVVFAEDEAEPKGKIVRVSPEPEERVEIPVKLEADEEVESTKNYWIGISGRPVESPVLKTHLQLAADMGVVIERVVSESPADKAGLRKHDIILRVNGIGVQDMKVLQAYVGEHQGKSLELKFIRLGKEETLVVVPERRPIELRIQGLGRKRKDSRDDVIAKLMEQFQGQGGLPGGMRRFGGGGVFLPDQQAGRNLLPNGVSVSIQRENEGPAKITVKQGDQTWHVVGDDPKSLEQLPEELRPFVQGMLRGQGAARGNQGFDWEAELEHILPDGFGRGGFGGEGFGGRAGQRPVPKATPEEQEIHQRMERMEQELRELQKRLAEE